MKKLIIVLVMLFSFSSVLNAEEEFTSLNLKETMEMEGKSFDLSGYSYSDEKINIYLFWGDGCPHCSSFIDYLGEEVVKDSGVYFNFYSYEVWKTENNPNLLNKVAKYFNVKEDEIGIPFIVIGDKYFVGFDDDVRDNIKTVIKDTYDNKKNIDVVGDILKGKIDVSKETSTFENRDPNKVYSSFEEAERDLGLVSENKDENTKDNNWIIYAVIGGVILVVVIICVVFLIRKKKTKK